MTYAVICFDGSMSTLYGIPSTKYMPQNLGIYKYRFLASSKVAEEPKYDRLMSTHIPNMVVTALMHEEGFHGGVWKKDN